MPQTTAVISCGNQCRRLVYFKQKANQTYWDECWNNLKIEETDSDPFLITLIQKQITNSGQMLENGCGLGQQVKALADIGYSVQGLDFSKLALRKAKGFNPRLCLIAGDAVSLPFQDNSFSCCLSFGVVEHFKSGPELPLKEIYRTLRENGKLIISVPHFNVIRKIKGGTGKIDGTNEFYQYAFSIAEFKNILKANGFRTSKVLAFDALDGLKDAVPGMRILWRMLRGSVVPFGNRTVVQSEVSLFSRVLSIFLNSQLLCRMSGHMVVFVATKR
jgi:SAM-dependent methyltransferase